jgi:hypothetical protein
MSPRGQLTCDGGCGVTQVVDPFTRPADFVAEPVEQTVRDLHVQRGADSGRDVVHHAGFDESGARGTVWVEGDVVERGERV